ncbi:hypothetical protein EPO66_00065 [bacterium]|nr:MAG: hypothetical protein EPO66_00065 [bacterium]
MKNKIAIVFCVHHKPWLMMSTLITTMAQNFHDMDIIFLYQMGDGACFNKPTYKEYHYLAKKCGMNPQLSDYDARVRDICKIDKFNISEIEFENDHGLDSGAWYKFIRTGLWEKYDRVIFIQEGNLFTGENVLRTALEFAEDNKVDFLSAGHEKQKLPKSVVLQYNSKETPSEINIYHDAMMRETFEVFCRDREFKRLFDNWDPQLVMTTQNHVPDILLDGLYHRLRQIARSLKRKHELPVFTRTICENTYRRILRNVIDNYTVRNKVIFHKANDPEWFGCSCQHMFSREFLRKFSVKLNEHKMYDVLDMAYCGTSLEIIWGFLPNWLGFDKWFFDGFHRVRKNFVSYKREDDREGMCRYINLYFKGLITVVPEGDFVKITKMHRKFDYMRSILPSAYFKG